MTVGTPAQPVLSYGPATNQSVLGYIGPPQTGDGTFPSGRREVMAQAVTATGAALLSPFRLSNTDSASTARSGSRPAHRITYKTLTRA